VSSDSAFVGNAGAPFDRQDADIVLRSQDGIDFRTFKAHLSSASDLFNHMFSTANEGEVVDGLPVVPFYDPSPILKALLCYCDPTVPTMTSRSSSVALVDIQKLAMKYEISVVAKEVYKNRIKQDRKLTIMRKIGQDEDMYLAAATILTCPENEAAEMVEVGLVSQEQFDSLLQYRDECRAKAGLVAQPEHGHFKWMSPRYKWVGYHEGDRGCDRGGTIFIGNISGKIMMRRWWWLYMQEARRRLEKQPWGTTVKTGDFFDQALKAGARCKVCAEGLDHDFREFVDIFAREVDSAVSRARYRTTSSLRFH